MRSPVLAKIVKPNSINEIRCDRNMFNNNTVVLTTLIVILLVHVLNICWLNFCCSFAITSLPQLHFEVRPLKDCQIGKNGVEGGQNINIGSQNCQIWHICGLWRPTKPVNLSLVHKNNLASPYNFCFDVGQPKDHQNDLNAFEGGQILGFAHKWLFQGPKIVTSKNISNFSLEGFKMLLDLFSRHQG